MYIRSKPRRSGSGKEAFYFLPSFPPQIKQLYLITTGIGRWPAFKEGGEKACF
jgi:hypothetical protein